jgi:alpha 1,3-glucosidase
MWMQYPQIESLFATDDQYLIGSSLLVKPVTAPNIVETTILFPTCDAWYDVDSMQVVSPSGDDKGVASITVASDIDKIPVYQRGGSIIPRKLRLRRSSRLMTGDPYTLYIALDKNNAAVGELHMDDEETFAYVRQGAYGVASFSADFTNGFIRNTVDVGPGWASEVKDLKSKKMIERIIVMGVKKAPTNVSADGEAVSFDYDSASNILVLRKPNVSALSEWRITIL